MAQTYCTAEMKFIDVTAKEDSTITATGQDFDDLDLLKGESSQAIKDYATLAHNMFTLDGSKEIIDKPADIAYMAPALSNSSRGYSNNPKIEIAFSSNHSTNALTLYFERKHPTKIRITWYAIGGNKIIAQTFDVDSNTFVANQQVQNFGKITIEFLETAFPRDYINLQYILYGRYILWSRDEIQSASITEEIDTTGAEITINTATVSIMDEIEDFNVSNSNGLWQVVQKTQPLRLTETKDGQSIEMGTFYVKDFSFASNVAKFELIDGVGILDNYTFYAGDIYTNTTAGTIIKAIFDTVGILDYEVDNSIAETELSGYLAVQSCRQALQQVAFVCGAVVDDSRSDVIRIYKPNRQIKNTIDADRKFNGNTKVSKEDYYSGVSITCKKYSLASESKEIYNNTLAEGESRITFDTPYKADTIETTSGTLKEVHTNYLIIDLPTTGEVTITGMPYESSEFTVTRSHTLLEAGETENIKAYSGITLYNQTAIASKLKSLLSYYDLRKSLSMTYLLQAEKVSEWALVKDGIWSNATLIESQDIDLTGGFISKATCRGYTLINATQNFTGSELFTFDGEGGAII